MAVKAASDRAIKVIEVSNPWGEYYAKTANSIPPLVYMDMVVQSGINFDAFGLRIRFGRNRTGMHLRDMMHVSSLLDYYGPISKPLYMTEVEVPSKSGEGQLDGRVAGIWHSDWDESLQAAWIEQFCKVALSKQFVDRVTYARFADRRGTTLESSGLLTEDLKPKASYVKLKKLHDSIFLR